jgi:hypothetical protein
LSLEIEPIKEGAGTPLTGLEALGEPLDTIREPTPKREPLLIISCLMKISEVSKSRLKAKASISLYEDSLKYFYYVNINKMLTYI